MRESLTKFAYTYAGRAGISADAAVRFGSTSDDEVNGPAAVREENKVRREIGHPERPPRGCGSVNTVVPHTLNS
jgi:hypothetical protein